MEVYITQPKKFMIPSQESEVWYLKKTLYGL